MLARSNSWWPSPPAQSVPNEFPYGAVRLERQRAWICGENEMINDTMEKTYFVLPARRFEYILLWNGFLALQ